MFARSNIVQNTISHVRKEEKTDAELIEELEVEKLTKEESLPLGRDITLYKEGSILYWIAWQSQFPAQITEGKYEPYFNMLIIMTIVLAGILVGMQTYREFEDHMIIEVLNSAVLGIFILECILKLAAEGTNPKRYFIGPDGFWNTFDFFVIILSLPIIPQDEATEGNAGGLRILSRVARLVRLAKIIKRIPQLHVIIKGLLGGLTSITFIGILLGLVFYVYAVAGVLLFKPLDPFHFGTVSIALTSLFRASTLENWAEIMNISYYGCQIYPGDIYQTSDNFPAITRNGCMDSMDEYPSMYHCISNDDESTQPKPVTAAIFWLSFIVISSLVMLSLFIGVVTMSMQDSMNDMRSELELANRKRKLLRATKTVEELSKRDDPAIKIPNGSFDNSYEKKAQEKLLSKNVGIKNTIKAGARRFTHIIEKGKEQLISRRSSMAENEQLRDIRQMKRLMMHAWHGTVASDDHHDELTDSEQDFFENLQRKLTLYARNILHTKWFHHLVTTVILMTAVIVGLQADRYEDETVDGTEKEDSTQEDKVLNGIEWGIIIFFAGEILIRFAGEGFHLQEYLRDWWNVFDCFVCIGSIAYRGDGGDGRLVVVLRTLRLLRVLKLVKSLPQLALIVNALIMGLSSIGFIGVILFLAFYMFSIMGIFLFGENDKVHFASLQEAFLTLFRCATLDNWGPVLYVNAFGCEDYPPPYCTPLPAIFSSCREYKANITSTMTDAQKLSVIDTDLKRMCGDDLIFDKCKNPQEAWYTSIIFFTIFIVIAAFILLTLFVGVVTTSMEEASKQQNIEIAMEEKIQEVCQGHEVTTDQLEIYRRVFNMLDLDGGGTIDSSELRVGLRCVNIIPTDAQLEEYVIEIDQNNDGSIDLIEFVVFMTNMKEKNIKEKQKRDQEAALKKPKRPTFGMSFRVAAGSGKYRSGTMDSDDLEGEVSSQKSNKSPSRRILSFFNSAKIDTSDDVSSIETGPVSDTSGSGIYRQLPPDRSIKPAPSTIQEVNLRKIIDVDIEDTSVDESDIEEMDI